MKTLAILSTIVLCSCAEFGAFEATTQYGTLKRDEDGRLIIVPIAKPIVIDPSK